MNHSIRVVDNYERKYVHEVLVNHLFKLVKGKVWLGELTIAVDWDMKQHNKQTNQIIYEPVHKILVLLCVQKFSEQRFFAFISLCAD